MYVNIIKIKLKIKVQIIKKDYKLYQSSLIVNINKKVQKYCCVTFTLKHTQSNNYIDSKTVVTSEIIEKYIGYNTS